MKTGTMVEYAVERTHNHLLNFWELVKSIEKNCLDETRIEEMEQDYNIFPDIDYKIFASTP